MVEGKALGFDLMIGDPLIAAVEAGEGGIPFDFGDVEFMRYLVVEVFSRGVVVVGEVEDPF